MKILSSVPAARQGKATLGESLTVAATPSDSTAYSAGRDFTHRVLFRGITLHGGSFVAPDGSVRYTADASGIMTREATGGRGSVQHYSIGSSIVRGRVVDTKGQPVEGAALLIDNIPVFTDSDGRFFLRERRPQTHTLQVLPALFGRWKWLLYRYIEHGDQPGRSAAVAGVHLHRDALSPGTNAVTMILPKLRTNLDFMVSPVRDRPGLLIRDFLRYSDATLIVPPPLIPGLLLFDGTRTDLDLQTELARSLGSPEIGHTVGHLIEALSRAGFLEDQTYADLKRERRLAFTESPVRQAAHAGSAYPEEIGPLRDRMRQYLGGEASTQTGIMGIAAPHVSPQGGWQGYRAAYKELTPDLRDRTFMVLGTSHHGQPDKFGLTRKPFETPLGKTRIDQALVAELEAQPAALPEDYCHAVEHSIEFQVIFLQAIYGADVRILPLLCGSFGRSIRSGGFPEDDEHVKRFLGALGEIAEREKERLFWVLGVDMAHMGLRFGDKFAAHANRDEMNTVKERDNLRIDRMNASDAGGFWDLVKENQDDLKWCGSSPIYTFMKAVPQARGTLHRYEQWNIDENSVVSFAGISFAPATSRAPADTIGVGSCTL